MKSGATEKVKFAKLKRRLGLPYWQVVGVLESLWLFTLKNAPAGDLGKFSNEDIAAGIEWADDADTLIDALIKCSWLDECEVYRLVVHDWEEHAPTYLKGAMHKNGREFVKPAKQGAKQGAIEAANSTVPSDVLSSLHPNQALPNLSKSRHAEEQECVCDVVKIEPFDELVKSWTEANLPGAGKVERTPTRVGWFQQRQADDGWRSRWRQAVERAGRSSRCKGLVGNWTLTIDAFLKHEDMAVRILEGEFDDRADNGTPATSKRTAAINALIDRERQKESGNG